jgi:uncharacterized lipoprotein YmbA
MKQIRFLLPLLILCLEGCGSSPPTQFFTLAPTVQPGNAVPAAMKPVTIGIVDLPETLSRLEIIRSVGPNQIVEADIARWSEPLDDMSRRVLLIDLQRLLPSGTVHMLDSASNDPSIDVINLEFQRFDSDTAGHVTLDADWTITTGNPVTTATRSSAHITETAADAGYPAMADAMSRALGDLAVQISSQLPPE